MPVRLPDPETHKRALAQLPFSERRAIIRAVNRGRAVESRKHAAHAVMIARQQQRTWRWMWVVGALIGLVQIRIGWLEVVVGAMFGALTMALVGWWFTTRARRAEEANLALLQRGGGKRKKPASGTKQGGGQRAKGAARGHIPRSRPQDKGR